MSYTRYYTGGWQSGETGKTPITPEALNHMENGIAAASTDFAQAVEHSTYKGCFYRTVDGVNEWVNPPMVLETEYRTAERHNGKAVYKKAVSVGTLPATGSKNTAHKIYQAMEMVGFDLFVDNGTIVQQFPFLNVSGGAVAKVHVTDTNIVINVMSDASTYTGVAVLRYTKD